MPATAPPPAALSPAAEAVLARALELPAEDRRALAARLTAAPPAAPTAGGTAETDPADAAPGPPLPAALLAELERDWEEVIAGRARTYSLQEILAEADRVAALADEDLPPDLKAARAAGRAGR